MTHTLLALLLQPVHAPPRAHDLFDLRSRGVPRHFEQCGLVLRRRDPRERAHLGKGKLAASHGIADLRHGFQRPGNAHLLAGGTRCNAGAPTQPVRTTAKTGAPAFAKIEFPQSHEQLVRGCVQVRGPLGDLIAQLLEFS